jgi:hypothetical protein
MNDQGQLTQEFNSASNEFIEVGIRCLDEAEKSIRNEKPAASRTPTAVSTMVTPNNARKSTPRVLPSSNKLTSENEDTVLVSTSVDGDITTSTSSTNQEEEAPTCVVATGTVARPPRHSYSPKYTPQKKKKISKEQAMKDPRGLPLDYALPSTGYCSACRCRFLKCHEVVFGEFCELYIVNEVEHAHWYLVDEYIEEIFTGKYSEALQFKVHEQMGKYDGRKGGYKLPDCVRNNALARSLQYGNFHTYHYSKYDKLEEGHNVPNRKRNHLFERQLVKDGHYAAMMKDDDGEDEIQK